MHYVQQNNSRFRERIREKPRVITLTPKAIALGVIGAAAIYAGYLLYRGGKDASGQGHEPSRTRYEQSETGESKESLYQILKQSSPLEIASAVEGEKRKVILRHWMRDLTITEKLEFAGPVAKETAEEVISGAEKYSRRLLGGKVDYGAFYPALPPSEAAEAILGILGGK